MENVSYLIIIGMFLVYYLLIIIFEKKIIQDPTEIVEKFLATILAYAGASLIWFSLTGKPFLTDNVAEYYVYIFMIGFIAVLWAVPNLLSEFRFFKKFTNKKKIKKIEVKK